ncbi:hypothetical protein D477_005666 [Arthrobacter crystallopoietes BAB-32]|uniref:DUF4031 domain-containing protein n=1 Tax=Arthrobacter crystallopoietes BAB-32 TaxID=1246476 RepID=N1UXS3_9MICC|nr:DUF4031 domain-containing protein [Arthrobacter crystallopoietes]EMY35196.1 hypothetical protein D477_005666 [Arthrobacter crystallopoietes BAB-32]
MAVLIDPPRWPAHGTLFSHLVSDTSLDELHAFASVAGVPSRAFDQDHYDVPAERYADLVLLGALEVSGAELVRRLIRSGLRIPARQRSTKLGAALATRWAALLPEYPQLGRELVRRWGEEHRHYHDRVHLLAVLDALQVLLEAGEKAGPLPRAVWLAAWFHDAVYNGVAGQDERDSAELAARRLPAAGIPAAEVAEVVRLVLLTAAHSPETGDDAGALLCDADLSVLGEDPAGYRRYVGNVRKEYARVGDADFAAGRAAVVRRLLALDPLYRTATARKLWLERARTNLSAELAGGSAAGC